MKITMVNGKIAVERVGKSSKKDATVFFAPVEVSQSLGLIKYVAEGSKYKIDQKVYYGNKREEVRMAGVDVQVMDEDNIIAIAEEENEEPTQQS